LTILTPWAAFPCVVMSETRTLIAVPCEVIATISASSVTEEAELVAITSQGTAIKVRVSDITTQGKTAQGVRIVNIDQPDFVVGVDKAEKGDDEEEQGE